MLDTVAGVWCDTKAIVTSVRAGGYSANATGGDTSFELIRRCRHAAAAVGDLVSAYGGLRCGMLLDDLIVAENCHAAETTNDASPTAATTTTVAATKQTGRFPNICSGPENQLISYDTSGVIKKGQRLKVPIGFCGEQDSLTCPLLQENKEASSSLEIRVHHCHHSRGLG